MDENLPAIAGDMGLIPGLEDSICLGATKPTGTESTCQEPVLLSKSSHCSEKPMYHNCRVALLIAARESLHTARKTQHNQK